MRKFRNITTIVALTFVVAWISGCSGCAPPPEPQSMSPTEGAGDRWNNGQDLRRQV